MSAAPVPPAPEGPVDRGLLGIYLNDHLAGAAAGARRMRRTADTLRRTPVGRDIDRVAREVAEEREELRRLIGDLGLHQSRPKQVATRAAELVGRLKSNGRIVRSSPMTPLLEVELLRSAVTGKLGLWQVLAEIGEDLGVDTARMAALVDRTQGQVTTLDAAHRYLRSRALRERG